MINKISHNVWQLHFKGFGSCAYLIEVKGKPILIDTSSKEVESELLNDLKELTCDVNDIRAIILTHNHWDHNGNLSLFPDAKVYDFHNLDELKTDYPYFKIIKTPGHTRDSIALLYGDILFSGDTLFHSGYIGRTDLPESVPDEMDASLAKLKSIPYRILAPGHLV